MTRLLYALGDIKGHKSKNGKEIEYLINMADKKVSYGLFLRFISKLEMDNILIYLYK
jgi:hypothetical protein